MAESFFKGLVEGISGKEVDAGKAEKILKATADQLSKDVDATNEIHRQTVLKNVHRAFGALANWLTKRKGPQGQLDPATSQRFDDALRRMSEMYADYSAEMQRQANILADREARIKKWLEEGGQDPEETR